MKTETTTTTCSKEEIRALLTFASKDFTRCYHHVLFTPSVAVATDGHRLSVLCVEEGAIPTDLQDRDAGVVVDREALTLAVKACRKDHVIRIMRTGKNVARVQVIHAHTEAPAAEFPSTLDATLTYPPYWQVLPQETDAKEETRPVRFGVNAYYLADLATVVKACPEAERTGGVAFHPGKTALDPMLAKCGDWTVVIMPLRLDVVRVSERKAA